MPRSPCHFSLVFRLHERLREEGGDAAALAERHLPELLAGSVAPDGLRYVADMGKFGTHFYLEDREETWGDAVCGMFRTHPGLADPGVIDDAAKALVIGYISHLTVDEAFRDTVTHQLHGTRNWRPLVEGLWSLADEIPNGYADVPGQLHRFERRDEVGFIRCSAVADYVRIIGGWASPRDPWQVEQVYHRLVRSRNSLEETHGQWMEKRERARALMDAGRREAFIHRAVESGHAHVMQYIEGGFRSAQESRVETGEG